MLVLSRKVGEVIVVGEGDGKVEITVVRLHGNRVRLGIKARPDIPIVRDELQNESDEPVVVS